MADWYICGTVDFDDGSVAYTLQHLRQGRIRPLRWWPWFVQSVEIPEKAIRLTQPELFRWAFRWLLPGKVCSFLGLLWLAGPHDLGMYSRPAWIANPITVWIWLAVWTRWWLWGRVAVPVLKVLLARGVLELDEACVFQWRQLGHYFMQARRQRRDA